MTNIQKEKRPAQFYELAKRFEILGSRLGISSECRRWMLSPLFLVAMGAVGFVDITKFGEWMENEFPGYRDKSIAQFLRDKDEEHFSEWKELFGLDEVAQ